MQPEPERLEIETRLTALQVRWPKVDVAAQWRKACAKYGRPVELGWLESAWLPRCRHARRRSRAAIASALATDVFLAAKAEAEPAGWPAWWAARYPTIDRPAWPAAPLDLKLRFAREQLAVGPSRAA
ncbi:MAG: hypothetical protein ACOZE5_08060 [Verrucomicrobiota bacterium]